MIAPFFLFFILFVLIPIGVNIVNSFTNYNLDTKKWVGLRNYARLFRDAYFLRSMWNTAIYAVFSVIPLVIIGFVAAMVVKRQNPRYVCGPCAVDVSLCNVHGGCFHGLALSI